MQVESLIPANLETKVIEVIEALAHQLGVAKDFIWETLVRQQYVEAVQLLIVGIVFGMGFYVTFSLAKKGYKNELRSYDSNTAALILGSFGWVISIIAGTTCLVAGIGRLINPAYYALADIMGMITGCK